MRNTQEIHKQFLTGKMCTHLHIYTKPPSGQRLTLTLKGLCLAPVITSPQAGFVVNISTSTTLCLGVRVCLCVKPQYMGVNSCRHPRHPEPIVVWVCVHVPCGLLLWEPTAVPPTMLRGEEQLWLWWRCLWWWGHRKWDHSLRLYAHRAYQGARPRGEYQSLISQPHWKPGTVFLVQFIKVRWILWLHQAPSSFSCTQTSPIFSLFSSLYCNEGRYH